MSEVDYPGVLTIDVSSEDYERRMKAAKARAEWDLGSKGWAGVIIGAFLYPEADSEALEREKAD